MGRGRNSYAQQLKYSLSSNKNLNRKALRIKRSFDEINDMLNFPRNRRKK